MPRYPIELVDTPLNAQELHDQKTRNNRTFQENQSNVITTIDDAESIALKVTGNNYNYAEGVHAALAITKDDAYIDGVPGTSLDANEDGTSSSFTPLTTNGTIRYNNVTFDGTITVADGTAIFTNCIFNGTVSGGLPVRCIFIGCVFRATPDSTDIDSGVLNFVIGCSRQNAGTHATALTIIAEST
tara:strand:+ start:345 stop:902 length:558 start_codon:yes stop_codon:yes gene_type:complete